jgi:SulP family sulfate permease
MGNMLSAGVCGPIGYSSVGKTMLCHSMGGHYFSGLFSVGYYVGYIVVGFYLARFIPLPVLGAFIFAIGMELLVEWLVHYRKKVTSVEYKETVLLFLLMTLNFVVGFFVGMFFSLIVFASRYAVVPVI